VTIRFEAHTGLFAGGYPEGVFGGEPSLGAAIGGCIPGDVDGTRHMVSRRERRWSNDVETNGDL